MFPIVLCIVFFMFANASTNWVVQLRDDIGDVERADILAKLSVAGNYELKRNWNRSEDLVKVNCVTASAFHSYIGEIGELFSPQNNNLLTQGFEVVNLNRSSLDHWLELSGVVSDVLHTESDLEIVAEGESTKVQRNAPWGLDRINQRVCCLLSHVQDEYICRKTLWMDCIRIP